MKLPTSLARRLIAVGLSLGLGAVALAAPPLAGAPNKTEANITRLTTGLLEHSQFAHHPLDSELAGKFLDGYLDALDGRRSLFLQSDVQEFAAFRPTLAQATRDGDTTAAHAIWRRYQQRLGERTAYLTQQLKTAKFEFTGHDTFSFDREHAQRPRDMAAAQAGWLQELRAEYLDEKLRDVPEPKIAATLTRRYEQQQKTMQAFADDDVLEAYLNALAHVYDPHSDYLGHEQMESLSISMNLSLFGIGAVLESKDGYTTIREMVPGGPAARGGVLQPGDRIVAVAQAGKDPVDIVSMPLSRAVELIRGPKGTGVTLTIIPGSAPEGSAPKTVALVRDEIQLEDQQAKARIVDLPNAKGSVLRVGVLDLPSFYADMAPPGSKGHRSVTSDVAKLLTKLQAEHVQGLIVDLRRNGGGSLEEAISLTGLFIPKGPVVQTKGPDGKVEVDADTDPSQLYGGPLVLLTSRFSASASEILSGALQDYGRALVVGDSSTFGKGTVQSVLPLARLMDQSGLFHSYDPGALKVTIRKFYRPGGASTQMRGVESNIVLPSTTDFSAVSESAMKDPLPWDAVPASSYTRDDRVSPYVEVLRQRSAQRIASSKDFAYLADDIARLRGSLEKKTVSLNEAERRKEMADAKARQAERDKERATRKAQPPRSYEITLKNAGSPGLPPPLDLEKKKAPKSAAKGGSSAPDDANDPPEPGSREDVILTEAQQILSDYIDLQRPKAKAKVGAR
ncbi:MAG TPA: carboxy terminal-processing peptidase [Polyangiaceae bacterium]|nr:carboxy terminal-processing peptidase [Polyangiaceae bacterium]